MQYLNYTATTEVDGYVSPAIGLNAISILAVVVSGSCDWQIEGSLDGSLWYKLRDSDSDAETFGSNNAPSKFIVDKYRFARVYVSGSIGTQTVKAKGLYTSTATGSGSGTITGGSNLGAGEGVFVGTSGSNLTFKSLTEGSNITLTASGTEIEIAATGTTGVPENTFQENKNFWNEAIYHLRISGDGYATTSNLTGLEQTEIEHYVQESQALQTVLKDLDGYAQNSTVTEHYQQQGDINKHILVALDGYAGGGGVSETTFQENKNAWNEAIYHLRVAADGYLASGDPIVGVGGSGDGYGGDFTGGTTNGHGLISRAAGDGYGIIAKATTGYALFAESNVASPDRSAVRIVPQTSPPVSRLPGDLYIHQPNSADYGSKLCVYNGQDWDRYIPQCFSLTESITLTASGNFLTYTIPANSLRVGSHIRAVGIGIFTAYSSGTARFNINLNGAFLIADSEVATPASGWAAYLLADMDVFSIGTSGVVGRGGQAILGPASTRANTNNCPVTVVGTSTVDTTADITIFFEIILTGTATFVLDAAQIQIT